MGYRLRTLLIVLALGPMLLAWGWGEFRDYINRPPTCVVPPYTSISATTPIHVTHLLGNGETAIAKMTAEHSSQQPSTDNRP